MRDIRTDLQERADWLKRQIESAQEQFEKRCQELKREHAQKIAELEDQLDALKRLLIVATWHQNVRSAMAAAVKVATVAADATKSACQPPPPKRMKVPATAAE